MTAAQNTTQHSIRPHNEAPSAIWSSGGAAYDEVSRGILDAIEHAINRLEPSEQMRCILTMTNSMHSSPPSG